MKSNQYGDSLAVRAHQAQDLFVDNPRDSGYTVHDNFQNGIIENGQPVTFYRQVTDSELEGIKNGNSNISSFLSDEKTVQSCVDEKGNFNVTDFSEKTQTQAYVPMDRENNRNGYLQDEYANYRSGVAAFDVNWEKLNDPENSELKERLCNPDGLSPGSDDIKMAYGKAEANKQHGEGGGNQYYLDRDTFNDAINAGVFSYNADKSYHGDKCQNTQIPIQEAAHGDALAENQVRGMMQTQGEEGETESDTAKKINSQNCNKDEINSFQNTDDGFVTKPDMAYGYDKSENEAKPKGEGEDNSENQAKPKGEGEDNSRDGGKQNNDYDDRYDDLAEQFDPYVSGRDTDKHNPGAVKQNDDDYYYGMGM